MLCVATPSGVGLFTDFARDAEILSETQRAWSQRSGSKGMTSFKVLGAVHEILPALGNEMCFDWCCISACPAGEHPRYRVTRSST